MTIRDQLQQKTSYQLYRILSEFVYRGGELDNDGMIFYETVGDEDVDEEKHHDALVEMVCELYDDDLLPKEMI